MLFGNYERNSGTAQPIWKFWDEVSIEDTAMVGWWEDDVPVTVLLAHVPTPPPSNISCIDAFTHTVGSFISAAGGASGDIGFGGDCGPPGSNQKYPKLTVEEAKAQCCELDDQCVGFSWANAVSPTVKSDGCFEKNNAGMVKDAAYDGYEKKGKGPAGCKPSDIKATTYVNFGKLAVVVISSWCTSSPTATVSLAIDWTALGLTAAAAKVKQPAVEGVQTAVDHGKGDGHFTIRNVNNGGAMLVITN
jgi:hypothetical protein